MKENSPQAPALRADKTRSHSNILGWSRDTDGGALTAALGKTLTVNPTLLAPQTGRPPRRTAPALPPGQPWAP